MAIEMYSDWNFDFSVPVIFVHDTYSVKGSFWPNKAVNTFFRVKARRLSSLSFHSFSLEPAPFQYVPCIHARPLRGTEQITFPLPTQKGIKSLLYVQYIRTPRKEQSEIPLRHAGMGELPDFHERRLREKECERSEWN